MEWYVILRLEHRIVTGPLAVLVRRRVGGGPASLDLAAEVVVTPATPP